MLWYRSRSKIVSSSSLDTIRLMTAVCNVNNVKKVARYTFQIIAIVLMKTLKEVHESSGSAENVSIWPIIQLDNTMFAYWYHVMQHIKNVFFLTHLFRETNIDLLIAALEEIVPLFLALDHVKYTKWVSVFIQDLK